jgi:hypothetical protein
MIDKIIGRNPNCYTGADCWNYDYSDRWLLLAGITISIVVAIRIAKKSGKIDL